MRSPSCICSLKFSWEWYYIKDIDIEKWYVSQILKWTKHVEIEYDESYICSLTQNY